MSPRAASRHAEIPHSTEAEQSVIGGVLVHQRKFRDVAEIVGPADFSHPACRAIFEAMTELDATSKPIDVVTVVEQMRALETFDKLRAFKGADYLIELMSKVVTVESLGHHAKIVRERARDREVLEEFERGRRAILSGEDGAGVAEIAGQRLSVISEAHDGGWPAPIAFSAFDLPPFPVAALPAVLADFVKAESEATQTPLDMTAMMVLAACAASLAKRVAVRINDGYVEPLNLFCVAVLPPGERKSAVVADVIAPLIEWEQTELERRGPEIRRAEQRYKLSEKRLEKAMAAAVQAKGAERERAERELDDLREQHAELKVPAEPRLLADDVTPEQLVTLMAGQEGRMALFSAEGGVLGMMAGRYSDAPNLDPYLKGHAAEPIRVDRRGRAEWIKSAALTVGLAVQPVVLEKLAEHPTLRGVGLLARFLWTLPVSHMGARQVDAAPVPANTRAAYHRLVRDLLGPTSDKPVELRLDPDAHTAYVNFARWLEPKLAEFGELGALRDWGAKLTGAMLRIAGILGIVAKKGGSDLPLSLNLSLADVERGIAVARYLVPHAAAAFAMVGTNPKLESAKQVLRCIERKEWAQFSRRDLQQALKGSERFKDADALDPALAVLVDRHFIRPRGPAHKTGAGRPRGASYLVSPLFKGRNSQNPRNGVSS
jgi:replicative DNA helicase